MTHVLRSDNMIYFDVDETLVLWNTEGHRNDEIILVPDPYIKDTDIEVVPHNRNIELLKRNAGQGRTVVVWSAGGYAWAESVIISLGLMSYVDQIMSKPSTYVDDRPMESWGLNRVYLNYDLPKKLRGQP